MRNGELNLNRRQCLYVEGVAAGKSRRRAALDAGYSLSSANNPGHNIERGRVREVFAELIRKTVSPELIAQRVREGLDAKETRVFAYEGRLIYSRPLVNYAERRQYAELAAKYGGYYVDKQKIELADQDDDLPLAQLIKKTEALLTALKETPSSAAVLAQEGTPNAQRTLQEPTSRAQPEAVQIRPQPGPGHEQEGGCQGRRVLRAQRR